MQENEINPTFQWYLGLCVYTGTSNSITINTRYHFTHSKCTELPMIESKYHNIMGHVKNYFISLIRGPLQLF